MTDWDNLANTWALAEHYGRPSLAKTASGAYYATLECTLMRHLKSFDTGKRYQCPTAALKDVIEQARAWAAPLVKEAEHLKAVANG